MFDDCMPISQTSWRIKSVLKFSSQTAFLNSLLCCARALLARTRDFWTNKKKVSFELELQSWVLYWSLILDSLLSGVRRCYKHDKTWSVSWTKPIKCNVISCHQLKEQILNQSVLQREEKQDPGEEQHSACRSWMPKGRKVRSFVFFTLFKVQTFLPWVTERDKTLVFLSGVATTYTSIYKPPPHIQSHNYQFHFYHSWTGSCHYLEHSKI